MRVALLVCSAALAGYGSVDVVQDLLNAITAVWLALAGVALLSILYERAILRR